MVLQKLDLERNKLRCDVTFHNKESRPMTAQLFQSHTQRLRSYRTKK